jgi:hemolysin activation/secretion protein
MIRKLVCAAITSYLLMNVAQVHAVDAPDTPDAGKTLREIEKQPELAVPKTTPPLKPAEAQEKATPVEPPKKKPGADVRLMVKSFHISGNEVISTGELEKALHYLVGKEHTLAELNDGAAKITSLYHAQGYVISRAYIPAQEIKDGVVEIAVQEGRVGKGRIYNLSRLSDQTTYEFLSTIRSGEVLRAEPIERSLLLLNETPGVASAKAALQPGASVGTTDVVVEMSPSAPWAANIQADNYGNYYTGQNRLGAEVAVNSPLKIGDLLSLRSLTAGENLKYAYFAYQVPIGGNGFRIGISHSATQYRLGKDLAYTQTHGTATVGSLFSYYPFIRSHKGNLAGTFTIENKLLSDMYLASPSEKQVQLSTFALSGDVSDKFGSGGINLASLSISTGKLSLDPASLYDDSISAKSAGRFYRINYAFNRLQRLSNTFAFSLAISGQKASKNLNSSEDFSLGGATGVRAYPQGEAMGDEGYLVNLELRHEFSSKLQGLVFYDTGSITVNHTPFGSSDTGPNKRTLSGAGIGVNARFYGVDFKASYAQRGNGGTPTAEPQVLNKKSRIWLQLGKTF